MTSAPDEASTREAAVLPTHADDASAQVSDPQAEWLLRVGQRMARELSPRALAEAMIIEALDLSGSQYGFVLQPIKAAASQTSIADAARRDVAGTTPADDAALSLLAIVSSRAAGRYLRLRDTLTSATPDPVMRDVLRDARAVFSNQLSHGAPTAVPGGCPTLRNFTVLPIRQGARVISLLCLVNSASGYEVVGVNRLQGLLDAFATLDSFDDHRQDTATVPNDAVHPVIDHSLRQFHALTHLAPVGILELDEHWVCVHCNERWCEMSQLDLEHCLDTGWIDVLHSTDVFQTLVTMRETLATGRTFRRELRLHTPPGSSRWVDFCATAMLDEHRRLCGTLIVVVDVHVRREAERQLRQATHYDPLTGLMNRNFFMSQLDDLLISGQGELALLHIDLDGFKSVNDTYGQAYGDGLLQQVASLLGDSVRAQDLVARLGSDEFSIVLTPMRDTSAVSVVADKIVQQVRQPYRHDDHELRVTASVGIAVATCGVSDARVLIRQASSALYRAKHSGRSRYLFYTPALEQVQREHSTLVTDLRQAVDSQAFELHYQPQLRIRDQTLLGFEALLRWPQADGSYIEPKVFVELLEQTGLIDEIGHWVIDQACAQHRQWRVHDVIDSNTTMSVNVSARQLGMPRFVEQVRAILQRYAMPPSQLILEITESALVQAGESRVIEQIRQLGVLVSLDDFGTGYSSLAYLGILPLDHLKIDRSFIANVENSQRESTIVKSIIALARSLDIRVIAEGVENERSLPLLAREGCEAYQGFFASVPVPADAIPALLRRLESTLLFDASPHQLRE